MKRRVSIVAPLIALGTLAFALAGCASPTPTAPTTTAAPTTQPPPSTPTTSPTPSPTPTPAESFAANIPGSCDELGTAASRADTLDTLTLQSDGSGFTRPSPEGATLALGCDEILSGSDSTGMLILISTATPDAVTAGVATLPDQGFTCSASDDFGADYCQKDGPGGTAPDNEEVVVARGDVWLYMSTSNINGRALLSDIATQIWAS